jgi:glycosyltransferase involved in cell wall biosynthesis
LNPIRVLQVVTIMNRGGLETMLMNYYRQMDKNKIQFDFMVHREEKGHYDDEIIRLGGRIYRMPQIRPGNYRLYFNKLDDFFSNHKEYKVVHSHINENSSFVLRAARKYEVPCRIAHSHLSDLGIDIKLPFRLFARYSMKENPNYYFACSKNAGKWLFGNKVPFTNNVTVLNNAVNTNEFKFNEAIRNRVLREIGVTNQLVVGHIGRFNKQKNHDYLIDIFNELVKIKPNAILVLVGDGHLKPQIEKKISNLGLSNNVRILGVRSDISDILQAIDLFLFPSLFEGLPVVLVEAQAAGLNCIISDSITKECDVTGRIQFLSLQDPPKHWAEKILSTTYEHYDTTEMLREKGFDTLTMSKWLSDYYAKFYMVKAK